MEAIDCLRYLVNEIHSVVAATVDEDGLPATCAIDLMDCDEAGLYLLTARGKRFYQRLRSRGYLALTGMKGADTLSRVAISLRGQAREIGPARLDALFEKNPYMKKIYPAPASRMALTVFQIYKGTGEFFDLSRLPVKRESFAFGGARAAREGYFVHSARCTACKSCLAICPQGAIDFRRGSAEIDRQSCIRCGNCFEVCPSRAIEKA